MWSKSSRWFDVLSILPHIHLSESLMLIAKPKQLMRVMRKHNLVNKKTTTKTNTKTMTMTMTNTFREHRQRAIVETFDL